MKIDELIRQQCPEGVETKRLGDIGTFRRGKGIAKRDMRSEDTGIPAVHYSQIFTDFGPVAKESSVYIEKGVVDNPVTINTGDILINIASVSPLGIGRATAWLGDGGVVASGNMVTISHEQDSRYLSYFLNSHYYEDQKNRIAREGVITYLSVPELKKVEIPLPSLEVQQEIADYLDDLKASTDELAENLEREAEIRDRLYKHERDRIIAEVRHHPGAQKYNFLDVASLHSGYSYTKKQEVGRDGKPFGDGIPVLRGNSIDPTTNTLNFNDLVGVERQYLDDIKRSKYLLKDDILMCVGSGSSDHIGKVAYSFEDTKYVASGFMSMVRCSDKVLPRYIFHLLTSDTFRGFLDDEIHSSTIRHITLKLLRTFDIWVPPLDVQQEIVDLLDEIEESNRSLVLQARQAAENYRKGYSYALNRLFDFSRFS